MYSLSVQCIKGYQNDSSCLSKKLIHLLNSSRKELQFWAHKIGMVWMIGSMLWYMTNLISFHHTNEFVEITFLYQLSKLPFTGREAYDLTQNLVVARFLFIFCQLVIAFCHAIAQLQTYNMCSILKIVSLQVYEV